MVAAEYMALDSSNQIAELVTVEKDNYNYIYPAASVSCLNPRDVC